MTNSEATMRSATTLEQLAEAMRAHEVAWPSDLPTFGGPEPRNTAGVWSWNATHQIVGTCADDLEIIVRPDIEETYEAVASVTVYRCRRLVAYTSGSGGASGWCAPQDLPTAVRRALGVTVGDDVREGIVRRTIRKD